ncbi:hypothetical protein JVX91_22600 [Pseudomonas sp. PDNC002]|uniref:hypothetical protein n=1 Tax=Pseudomonas sp. PDNC002 TaxID=2811422 RepID=UPI001966C433|nr:hypothetical protein [Pseudomonas sp. PDNC002]QRY78350.1 hypothetical protein JVX91_22600 [Pseudomonas sp. PDNC002]
MEKIIELVEHGSFSLLLAMLVAIVSHVVWRVFAPELEAAWFYVLLAILLAAFACLPNGLHWLLDIRHVDLAAVHEGKSHFPYSLLFIADLVGTSMGALVGVVLAVRVRRRRG